MRESSPIQEGPIKQVDGCITNAISAGVAADEGAGRDRGAVGVRGGRGVGGSDECVGAGTIAGRVWAVSQARANGFADYRDGSG